MRGGARSAHGRDYGGLPRAVEPLRTGCEWQKIAAHDIQGTPPDPQEKSRRHVPIVTALRPSRQRPPFAVFLWRGCTLLRHPYSRVQDAQQDIRQEGPDDGQNA